MFTNIRSIRRHFVKFISKKSNEAGHKLQEIEKIKANKKNTVTVLENLFRIRPFIANEMLIKCSSLGKMPPLSIRSNFDNCLTNGITSDTLLNHPQILCQTDLKSKIKLLNKLDFGLNETSVLLCLEYNRLNDFVCNEKAEDRIKYLSKWFQLPVKEVCSLMLKRPFLTTIPLAHVSEVVKLLNTYNIPTEDLVRDPWVLKYSLKTIEERLHYAKSNDIECLKTWMVRAQPEILDVYIKRRSENKEILGNHSIIEYLSNRLECTQEVAKNIITKHPTLKNKSLKKLDEIINFLHSEGFKSSHICRVPKILSHSVETMRKRLYEMHKLGIQLDSLHILTKSQTQYLEYCESYIKSIKNKEKRKEVTR